MLVRLVSLIEKAEGLFEWGLDDGMVLICHEAWKIPLICSVVIVQAVDLFLEIWSICLNQKLGRVLRTDS